MNLAGIISISGKPGLFKVVAQGKNNIIVECINDKKRSPAYSSDRISALEDISIYTHDEDVSLKVILKTIFEKEKGAATISHKEDKKKLENYLLEILPNYDQERVYISDVKKIFQWYNLLHKAGELKPIEDKTDKPVKNSKQKTNSKEKKTEGVKATSSSSKKNTNIKSTSAEKTSTKTTGTKKSVTLKTSTSRGK